MMRYRNIVWQALLGAALLTGCGKQIPKDIIQPDEMENVLYDYHLGIAISNSQSATQDYEKEAYKNYVFSKHHITEALFDSSMVWYTRQGEELADIYKNLSVRFRDEKKQVADLLSEREKKPEVSLQGDTVDLWHGHKLYWLKDAPLADKISFEIPSDSNFRAMDAFRWTAYYTFLDEGGQEAVMGLSVLFENDSVVGSVKNITQSGPQSLYLQPDSAYAIKCLYGFVWYRQTDSVRTEREGLVVSDLALMRYHSLEDSIAVIGAESQEVEIGKELVKPEGQDTLTTTEPEQQVPIRLNPREMKEQNAEQKANETKTEKKSQNQQQPQQLRGPRNTNKSQNSQQLQQPQQLRGPQNTNKSQNSQQLQQPQQLRGPRKTQKQEIQQTGKPEKN